MTLTDVELDRAAEGYLLVAVRGKTALQVVTPGRFLTFAERITQLDGSRVHCDLQDVRLAVGPGHLWLTPLAAGSRGLAFQGALDGATLGRLLAFLRAVDARVTPAWFRS